MKARILYLIKFYLLTVILMLMAKPVFMYYNREGNLFGLSDVKDVLWHGLTLDLSTALYVLAVPFLTVVVSLWMRRWNIVRAFLKGYYVLVALALAMAFTVDTSLYTFWGFKLDASVFQFIDSTGNALTSVSWWYVAVRLAVIAALAFGFYKAYVWITPHERQERRGISQLGLFRSRRTRRGSVMPLRSVGGRLVATLLMLLAIPLIVVGMRGGLSVSTTNVGQVYFSQTQFLNHSAVNPLFSFIASIGKSTNDIPAYRYFDDAECRKLLDGVFFTGGQPTDTLLNTQRPNILLVIMESCGGEFTQIGGRAEVTPNLTRLASEGVYFSQCYANSWRTDRGMVSILSGWPAFPDNSVMKMASKVKSLPSLAASLKKVGYSSTFLYGGDVNFTNTRGYLYSTGTETIISEDDFTKEERGSSKWGVCDSITFDRLYDTLQQYGSAKPWFVSFLTLSSHEPWTVPMPTKFDDEILNAFYYLDHCIGRFIERLRQTPIWNNTLVILLPDHGIKYKDIDETKPLRAHIPMIWTGGAVSRQRTIGLLCNQSDLAATLLGQMGLSHADFPFSRDILSPEYGSRQFVMHTHTDGFSVIDSTGFHAYDLHSERVLVGNDGLAVKKGKAVLQHTSADLRQR
ncbi:MAG: sulfatase-like hydrolase/transferase [Prevotella sp.]|nr:sulfatase-like hydrolase/transferase [Prevotella sp.]